MFPKITPNPLVVNPLSFHSVFTKLEMQDFLTYLPNGILAKMSKIQTGDFRHLANTKYVYPRKTNKGSNSTEYGMENLKKAKITLTDFGPNYRPIAFSIT